jgi:uncharacterized SAM-binding protein YcdF (DUF218 family)
MHQLAYFITRVAGFFSRLSNLMVVATATGSLLWLGDIIPGRSLTIGGILMLIVMGYSPIGRVLVLSLENKIPVIALTFEPDAIIALGGAFNTVLSAGRQAPIFEYGERIAALAQLGNRYPRAKLVVSGGDQNLMLHELSEGRISEDFLTSLGFDRSRLIFETQSRETSEHAIFVMPLLADVPHEKVVLITSAFHMWRSVRSFAKTGLRVTPYHVGWRTRGPQDILLPFSSFSRGLTYCDLAFREYLLVLYYSLLGRL